MRSRKIIQSVEEMSDYAFRLSERLKGGDCLLLEGELGAGKTTFVKALALALGVKEQVTSPTFTIVGEYDVLSEWKDDKGITKLVHVDLYRLTEGAAKDDLSVQEALAQSKEGAVVAVEWADRLGDEVPAQARRLRFSHGSRETERVVVEDK